MAGIISACCVTVLFFPFRLSAGENIIIGATANASIHLGADNNLISGNETFINDFISSCVNCV